MLHRLTSHGFQAYLVGGSVRDLLLSKVPKDFDVATSATPNEIRKLFKNARIIGRRFKLVHILYYKEIIEVATFRGQRTDEEQHTNERGMLVRDNVFGSLDEDAFRRDFTINSLYYNLTDSSIVDFTGGVQDVRDKLIRIIGDPVTRYQEDPVRMLRAIRFCAKLHFQLAPQTQSPIAELAHLISHISNARLFEEMTKLYQCGEAQRVQELLVEHGLFAHLFPQTTEIFANQQIPAQALIAIALENTDTRIRDEKPVTPAFLYAVILWFPMIACANALQAEGLPPLPSIDKAMAMVIAQQNKVIAIPKRFVQIIREIWLLQFRFPKRHGGRALHLLEHPRFRAAYDFLALRALAGDESMELAQWWTTFQEVDDVAKQEMMDLLMPPLSTKPKRRRKKAKTDDA